MCRLTVPASLPPSRCQRRYFAPSHARLLAAPMRSCNLEEQLQRILAIAAVDSDASSTRIRDDAFQPSICDKRDRSIPQPPLQSRSAQRYGC
jgi:hypothetical protein